MRIYSLKAILLGWAIGLLLFCFLMLLFANGLDIIRAFSSPSDAESIKNIYTNVIFFASVIVALTGGFVSGKIAKQKQLAHALLSGLLFTFVFIVIMLLVANYTIKNILGIVLFIVVPPLLYLLGGYGAKLQHKKADPSSLSDQQKNIEAFGKNQQD